MFSYLRFALAMTLVGSLGNCVSQAPPVERQPASVMENRGPWKLQRSFPAQAGQSEWQIVPLDNPAPTALSLD